MADRRDSELVVTKVLSVAQLLRDPRLARLYTFVLRAGEVTIDDIAEELGMPRTTAYSDAGTLADLGVLTRNTEQKTHTFTAIPTVLSTNLDGDTYTITPTLIEAVGRAPADQGLDLLLDRHGIGKLAAALTYAIPWADARPESTDGGTVRSIGTQATPNLNHQQYRSFWRGRLVLRRQRVGGARRSGGLQTYTTHLRWRLRMGRKRPLRRLILCVATLAGRRRRADRPAARRELSGTRDPGRRSGAHSPPSRTRRSIRHRGRVGAACGGPYSQRRPCSPARARSGRNRMVTRSY